MNAAESIRLSKWTHLIYRNNVYAIFAHSLRLSLLFFEERYKHFLEELKLGTTLEQLKKLDKDADGIIAELLEQQLVVPVGYDDNTVLCDTQKTYIQQPNLETIFMLLTDVCDLRCKYCFINGNMPKQCHGTKIMTWDTAKETIDMYFANLKPTRFHKTIVFYGGEPLIMFLLLKQIVSYISTDYGDKVNEFKIGLLLITNGTKITPEIAEYLAQHPEITICISLDGCEETNDQKRVYANGKGTFQDIMSGLARLHLAGRKDINISVKLTIIILISWMICSFCINSISSKQLILICCWILQNVPWILPILNTLPNACSNILKRPESLASTKIESCAR